MASLKNLFRRKSKKDLRTDRSATATPSPGRSPSSNNVRPKTPSSPPPMPSSPTLVTPTQNRARNSQGGPQAHQQYGTPMSAPRATPYEQLPSGATPERGTYPLHGNTDPSAEDHIPYQSRNTGGRPDSAAGGMAASGTQNLARRPVPPGTAMTTDQGDASRQRPGSRGSAYTDTSRYSDEQNAQRYRRSEDIPPVPKSYGQVDGNKRATIGTFSRDEQAGNHNRVVSASSAASVPRTPIADQFAAPSWYNQRGSPPVPEFSQVYTNNYDSTPVVQNKAYGSMPDGANNTSGRVNPQAIYANDPISATSPTRAPFRNDVNSGPTLDRSAALGKAIGGSNAEVADGARRQQPTQTAAYGQYDSPVQSNGDGLAPTKGRRSSIPRKSLEKPLPVLAAAAAMSGTKSTTTQNGQDMPLRERAPPAAPIATTPIATTNGFNGTADNAVRDASPPASPVRTGKYVRGVPKVLSKGEIRTGPQQVYNRPYLVTDAVTPPSLEGIVDLNNTVDTTTHVHYAPAVVHETILPSVHHIREEQITREIHNYHVHHRILPVIDVQVLPPKHVVRSTDGPDGEWIEIPEPHLPGREHRNWVIAETVSRIPTASFDRGAQGPRRFTARTFEGTQGDYKEYINADGVPTTETTWIYPPIIAQAARIRGITLPLDMD